MQRRKSGSPPAETPPPSFEESLAELEAIVEAMEHEHLSLEDLVSHYEKGSACLKNCEAGLNSARKRIELITLRDREEISLDDRDSSADAAEIPAPPGPPDDPDDDENDIRLF
jgi:exodeoxyribonuclease VII small subunit